MMKNLRSYFLILLGGLLVAIGTYFFLAPNKIAAGGISGAAIIINSIFPQLPIGGLMMVMEIILFTIGIIVIGPVFGGRTIFCSFSISGMVLLLEKVHPNVKPLSNDILVQLIFGILICGLGMAIVFNQNASTGGTDIIAKIINKYFKVSIGKSLLAADIVITMAATAILGVDKGLYAILGVIVTSTVIDKVIASLNTYKQVAIISKEGEVIKNYIMQELDRSATIYYAKGAYKNDESEVITTVVDRKQFLKLKDYIGNIDSRAFITVNEVNEVLGEGFAEMA
ncbi:YitT family protein [Clostridium sp. A1-XYC3]|uniref:YitT family protein n=1 Tax=Clostridium tanneri TaxID=3037988 RepID=A0ABU4JSZ3_9CLOT|nr:YitT family protein [Clostridium sp. A1-XYC3]MDW8801240.1 YitT family protein [Clostridium sp. A1-XYC3]